MNLLESFSLNQAMLEQILSSQEIQENGRIVYDSGRNEQTCVVLRHFHGYNATPKRLLDEKRFRDAFFAHQAQVLVMARSLLEGTDASLLVEGMTKDGSRPSSTNLDEIARREAAGEFSSDYPLNEIALAPPLNEPYFMSHALDQSLAGFRTAAHVRSAGLPNRVIGIEPTLHEFGMILLKADPSLSILSGAPDAATRITAEVQKGKDVAIVRGFAEGGINLGLLIIGASHTRHGTPAPDADLQCIEDLFHAQNLPVRVIVLEPTTTVWTY